jgi:hypothetical protein
MTTPPDVRHVMIITITKMMVMMARRSFAHTVEMVTTSTTVTSSSVQDNVNVNVNVNIVNAYIVYSVPGMNDGLSRQIVYSVVLGPVRRRVEGRPRGHRVRERLFPAVALHRRGEV